MQSSWGLGHLMQYLGSQYDMQKGKAELHMIGCRFITGASGMDTAVNMMRCLSEMLLCEIEEVTATEVKHNWSVTMVQGCEELLGSAPSDNTISAVHCRLRSTSTLCWCYQQAPATQWPSGAASTM